jgi:hypothetical protein
MNTKPESNSIPLDHLSDCLKNMRAIANGLKGISETMKEGLLVSRNAKESFELNQSKGKKETVKQRLRFVFEEKNSGKTYKQLGQVLSISAGRAMQLFQKAEWLHQLGRLYP